MNEQWIFLNGEFVPKDEAKVSVYDHGYLYGDGVFEGIRVYSGNVFRLREHLVRLYESAKSIMLEIPYSLDEVTNIVVETIRQNKLSNGYIRLVVSRGAGNLGLDPDSCQKPNVVVIAEQLSLFPQEYYEKGISVVTVATRRNRPDVLSPQVKSLNYLNNILVRIEAKLAGVQEALMLNDQGYVAEGSGDNVFIVKGNKLITPPSSAGALEGITRNAILEIGEKLGYDVREELFTRHDVYVADEVFLTGTAAEVIAVTTVDGRTIGLGQTGPHTNRLLEEFRKLVIEDGEKIYEENKVG
ncbi:branched-chain-amino-acid transaminase [Bacillus cereus group sp. TH152-1LC]|uniref:branched-chain-amino-acid transaminase n=1 Tax=Bacillus cereus group sp. TH152-1LC TaxID=3018060 RepID=UPI0022E06DCB|nr:branched-chain-amino-acid transaminase [Bacillus cereus group sp. TH152-1LC]MDA1678775.1 branched-chain-amino-acid transaminase [Bacillus cereus group sp. TH152-1LC]